MSTVVQPCARCGARWAVQGAPMHWCPRCRGVLLSPAPIDAPAERRNYRWVARRPDQRIRRAQAKPRAAVGTPRYSEIPRWGLRDQPPSAPAAPRWPFARVAGYAVALLLATAGAFGVAVLAELVRYLILLRNRSRLINPALLTASDWFVNVSALLALTVALVTALAVAGWLIAMRHREFERRGQRDSRPAWVLVVGCLVPVWNLIWPGVFLTEALGDKPDPHALRAIRIWWCAWVLGAGFAVAAVLWHFPNTLQAKADGVVLTMYTELIAIAVAVLTLWVMRLIDGRDLRGRTRIARRWVIAVDPMTPVIEPVRPGGRNGEADQDVTRTRAQEEVMAK
ncbi:DUF4328 domain-containing protein [Nocardia arthritidis]|uniref:DUF4328 domain-containing protein n=1 Tax=Nocardia arthritidis TaxID=228602 RepID=A0A6G9Y4F9_9NOCA|nr:DUF4328 domain-containing protein [Nocardia arthritidis]QIS08034.1 DUF4328 domain-containing protein [Nocardia arthritidis]